LAILFSIKSYYNEQKYISEIEILVNVIKNKNKFLIQMLPPIKPAFLQGQPNKKGKSSLLNYQYSQKQMRHAPTVVKHRYYTE
jgi:hypothetical protein